MAELYQVLSQDREIELGGQKFTLSKMTLNDQAKYDFWINEEVKKEAKDILKDMGKENDIDAYTKLKYNADLRFQISAKTTSTLQLFFLLISKTNKKITYEEFAELLTLEDLNTIDKIFDEGNENNEVSEAEKNVEEKK